jgi:hypothetical protein
MVRRFNLELHSDGGGTAKDIYLAGPRYDKSYM